MAFSVCGAPGGCPGPQEGPLLCSPFDFAQDRFGRGGQVGPMLYQSLQLLNPRLKLSILLLRRLENVSLERQRCVVCLQKVPRFLRVIVDMNDWIKVDPNIGRGKHDERFITSVKVCRAKESRT